MKLIVGLGNPGRTYARSRHNIGFMCVDHMARRWSINLAERRNKAVLGQGEVGGERVVLAKPRTFMNLSGDAAAYLLARFAATPRDLVVIYDEMDLSLGTIRIRSGGSAAGHNGIKSIISRLATQEFPRLRVGIGEPPEGVEGMDYVLGPFLPEERPVTMEAVSKVEHAVACLLQNGIDTAMNRFN